MTAMTHLGAGDLAAVLVMIALFGGLYSVRRRLVSTHGAPCRRVSRQICLGER